MQTSQAQQYTPVRITTLKPSVEIPFSVFIHFKEHYLELVKSGQEIDQGKYTKLKKQKITKFYISAQDEIKYQSFLDNILDSILNDKNASLDSKKEIVEGQALTAMEQIQENPESEESYTLTRKAASNIRKLIFENPLAAKEMFGDKEEVLPIFNHSLNVCILSVKFALFLNLKEDQIDFLATAALMHDIGLTKLDESTQGLFNKPKQEFSADEKKKYWSHCKDLKKILEDRPYINTEVIKLIENHEENLSGSGPNKVTKLSKTEEILSLVNTYDKKMRTQKLTSTQALKNMMIDELGNYELTMIKKFQELLTKEKIA